MTGGHSGKDFPEQELIARAVGGDRQALVALLYQHYEPLAAHLRRKLPAGGRGVLDVDDILQQTFLKAFQHIHTFAARGENAFYRWLRTLGDHACIDAARRRQCRPDQRDGPRSLTAANGPAPEAVDAETPSGAAARGEAVRAVHRALTTLPPRQREAVALVSLEGLSLTEAAQRLGTTRSAVRALIGRGLDKLREVLGSMSSYLSRR
jgi:RNA polymerase sigma-70 factor (ECF subfamily)